MRTSYEYSGSITGEVQDTTGMSIMMGLSLLQFRRTSKNMNE